MFDKFLIFVNLLIAAAVSAKLIPETIEEDAVFGIEYVGTDLFVGKRTGDDYQATQFGVWQSAEEGAVVTKTLHINTGYKLTYIHAHDATDDKSSGATATLVHGVPDGSTAELLFTSQPGKEIFFVVDVYVRR